MTTSAFTQDESPPLVVDPESKVRASSFYLAMRIMPRAQRMAMFAIYGFCRDVDDIADDGGPREERRAALALWRADIDALYATGKVTSRTAGLAQPVAQFGLKREDFIAIIDGMEMDIAADIRAPDMATLDLYCDRVASAVGRLSVRVFGLGEVDGVALAHNLGQALQLTNILRDIDEDAEIGRLYLPKEALQAAGIDTTDPAEAMTHPAIGRACAPLVDKARAYFTTARAIMARNPRRAVRTPMLMCEAYDTILNGVIKRGFDAPRARIKVSKVRMLGLLLRHGVL